MEAERPLPAPERLYLIAERVENPGAHGEEAAVILERGVRDERASAVFERGHLVADRLRRVGSGSLDRLPQHAERSSCLVGE